MIKAAPWQKWKAAWQKWKTTGVGHNVKCQLTEEKMYTTTIIRQVMVIRCRWRVTNRKEGLLERTDMIMPRRMLTLHRLRTPVIRA